MKATLDRLETLLQSVPPRLLALGEAGSRERRSRDAWSRKQILGHLAKGLTNQEIARCLGVNVRTVKHYLTQVFRRMRVRNRVEAVIKAQKMRLQLDGQTAP